MFTGIIASTAKIASTEKAGTGLRIVARVEPKDAPHFEGVVLGESIAVSGVCLTVERIPSAREFAFFLSAETLAKSHLGDITLGDLVNLERAAKLGAGLSGHIVQGHVDGIAVCRSVERQDEAWKISFEMDADLGRYIVQKGSIALDGISLTVNEVIESPDAKQKDLFSVMIIPHTWEVTTLRCAAPGRRFNVEVDVIAKYVERLISRR